jgi:hypothetical protein
MEFQNLLLNQEGRKVMSKEEHKLVAEVAGFKPLYFVRVGITAYHQALLVGTFPEDGLVKKSTSSEC